MILVYRVKRNFLGFKRVNQALIKPEIIRKVYQKNDNIIKPRTVLLLNDGTEWIVTGHVKEIKRKLNGYFKV